MSETGIGLMLSGPWPEDIHTELDLLVRLQPKPDTDPIEVRGTVRNSTPVNVGELRVGIEFTSRKTELLSIVGSFTPAARP